MYPVKVFFWSVIFLLLFTAEVFFFFLADSATAFTAEEPMSVPGSGESFFLLAEAFSWRNLLLNSLLFFALAASWASLFLFSHGSKSQPFYMYYQWNPGDGLSSLQEEDSLSPWYMRWEVTFILHARVSVGALTILIPQLVKLFISHGFWYFGFETNTIMADIIIDYDWGYEIYKKIWKFRHKKEFLNQEWIQFDKVMALIMQYQYNSIITMWLRYIVIVRREPLKVWVNIHPTCNFNRCFIETKIMHFSRFCHRVSVILLFWCEGYWIQIL